ncbi:MAG TPA: DUF1775 domain-containing protein [Gaiellaceae bacterium]|nr:DUF1775 domain-containing protein [Gaiellaceae bacterium]
MHRFGVFLAAVGGALVIVASASAHAEISPAVALAKHGQLFTLAVPTEKENATTTKVELTPPDGFAIDSFVPSPGWTRNVRSTGSGEGTKIDQVTWSGGQTPAEEDAVFQFLASGSATTYSFRVRQTYSDGSIVDWTGAESSDTPAPQVEFKSSLGGGGTSTLAIIALVVGVFALLVAFIALFAGGGRRALA